MFEKAEYIYEVYKEKSFSKAAENLYITQPALSTIVKKAEEKLGIVIFDRSVAPVRLTEEGQIYMEAVEKVMEIRTAYEKRMEERQNLVTGKLAVGANHFFAAYMLPELLKQFSEKYPRVDITLTEDHSESLQERLLCGELDYAVDSYPFKERFCSKQVYMEEELLLAVPGEWEINKRLGEYAMKREDILKERYKQEEIPGPALKNFAKCPFIFLKPGHDTRIRAEELCMQNGLQPEVVWELDQLATAYNVTASGMGITFVSDTVIKKVNIDKPMYYYKLEGKSAKRATYFYDRKNGYRTKAMQALARLAVLTGQAAGID